MNRSIRLMFIMLLVLVFLVVGTYVLAAAPPQPAQAADNEDSGPAALLLYGGQTPTIAFGDQWLYGGPGWTADGQGPGLRAAGGQVYDRWRGRVVVFGGNNNVQNFNDTWEYAVGSWTQIFTAHAPSPRSDFGMVFDSLRGVVVVHGGAVGAPPYSRDTWEYDGMDWTQVNTLHAPPSHISGNMVFDEARGRTVLVTGWQGQGFGWVNQTWEYDGTDWTFVMQAPSWRYSFALAYDRTRQRTVLFGGYHHGTTMCDLSDTWEYDGTGWTRVTTAHVPPGRANAAMTYDSTRGVMVLFGGGVVNCSNLQNDTWEYDGSDWRQVSTSQQPPPRTRAGFSEVGPTHPINLPPTASAGGPYSVAEGDSVVLTASGTDPENGPLEFAWDLNQDGYFETPGQGATFPAAELDGPTTLTITVQVTDNGGLSATDSTTVEVLNVDPTAVLSNDGPVGEGSSAAISFSEQYDPSLADTAAGFHYAFACDGGSLDGAAYAASSSSPIYLCLFDDGPAMHTVRARIIDKEDGYSEYTTSVQVNNTAPTASFGAASPVNEGNFSTLTLTDALDPSSADTAAGFHYAFACDGGSLDGATYASSSSSAVQDCFFDDGPSTHLVRARIIDKDDGYSEYTTTVTVNHPVLEYLHGLGASGNPPTLFLDTTVPTATTVKYRDSAAINFNGGNPWKEIGTWAAAPAYSAGTLATLNNLHVWLGLKNSDDQGTYFDVRSEVYKNGTLIASGETYCITGITRNPDLAKAAAVSFGSVSPTVFDGVTDVLSVKVLTRIGTDGAGGRCGGHSNAVGLRLYFDAVSRPSSLDAVFGP